MVSLSYPGWPQMRCSCFIPSRSWVCRPVPPHPIHLSLSNTEINCKKRKIINKTVTILTCCVHKLEYIHLILARRPRNECVVHNYGYLHGFGNTPRKWPIYSLTSEHCICNILVYKTLAHSLAYSLGCKQDSMLSAVSTHYKLPGMMVHPCNTSTRRLRQGNRRMAVSSRPAWDNLESSRPA